MLFVQFKNVVGTTEKQNNHQCLPLLPRLISIAHKSVLIIQLRSSFLAHEGHSGVRVHKITRAARLFA